MAELHLAVDQTCCDLSRPRAAAASWRRLRPPSGKTTQQSTGEGSLYGFARGVNFCFAPITLGAQGLGRTDWHSNERARPHGLQCVEMGARRLAGSRRRPSDRQWYGLCHRRRRQRLARSRGGNGRPKFGRVWDAAVKADRRKARSRHPISLTRHRKNREQSSRRLPIGRTTHAHRVANSSWCRCASARDVGPYV